MKAIIQDGFGSPGDVLELREIEEPVVGDDDVLVRIQAASVNIGASHMIRGVPYIMRPMFSMMKTKSRVPGTDIAGTVTAVGANVTKFQPGDEVFGSCKGAFAEYASVPEDGLAPKPTGFTFEQAAAVGVSASTALQGLRDHGKIQSGQKVLIIGASGGVGTFAVQIAKSYGAEVTGVCSTRNVAMVRSIGADHVVDYTQEDFTQGEQRYDLIFDNVGEKPTSETRAALTPDGTLLANGAPVGGWFGGLGHPIAVFASSFFVRQQGRPFIATSNKDDLATLQDLAASGKITPVIDRTYPLDQTPAAVAHVAEGHSQGTTVITVQQNDVEQQGG